MRICDVFAVIALTLASGVTPARAQFAGALDVGSGLGQLGAGAWQRESRFAPTLRAANRMGFLQFDAAAVERGGKFSLRNSALDGAISSHPFGVFRLSVSGQYSRDAAEATARDAHLSVGSALSAKVGAGGVWLGGGRATGSDLRLDLGVWRVFGGAIVSLASQTHSSRWGGRPYTSKVVTYTDSTYSDSAGWTYFPVNRTVVDSGSAALLQRWSDLEARVDWTRGRMMLSAAMSHRSRIDSARATLWGRVSAVFQVNSRVSFVAGGGTMPTPREPGAPPSRFASFGLRLSPAAILRPPLPPAIRPVASAFSLSRLAPDRYRITIRVPNARTVELSGDFNQWTPVALREAAPNLWQVTLPLASGTHRVNVRVDGDAWTAPPGIPTVDDEFNGRVGILVVR